jgi:hypothetical protein
MTASERPTVPPIECMPWCRAQDGHPNDWCRVDQVCWSEKSSLELSLELVNRYDSEEWPQRLGVSARRDHEGTSVYLHL